MPHITDDAPLCMTCGTKMKLAGSVFVCEGCGSTQEAPSQAYIEVKTKADALGHQLFELLLWDNWYGALGVTLHDLHPDAGNLSYVYYDKPKLEGKYGRHYLGGSQLTYEARRHKAAALGEKIDDDRLKELIEEVLKDELEKYDIVLQWHTRHNWDGSDRVLYMYHTSEKIPSVT